MFRQSQRHSDEFLEADRSARDPAERGHLAQGAPGTIARDDSSIFENPANDADSPQAGVSLHSGAPANCRERQTLFTRLTGLRVPGFTAGTSLNGRRRTVPARRPRPCTGLHHLSFVERRQRGTTSREDRPGVRGFTAPTSLNANMSSQKDHPTGTNLRLAFD